MTFDPTKPVQTRDGKKAQILKTDLRNGLALSIVAVISYENEDRIYHYHENGMFLSNVEESPNDLVNIQPTHEYRIVYMEGGKMIVSNGYYTKEEATKLFGMVSEPILFTARMRQ